MTTKRPISYDQESTFNISSLMGRAPGKIIHRDHWRSHLVEIIDNGDERSLYFAGHVLQSTMSRSAPHRLVLSYTQYMMAALLFNRAPQRGLMVGLGAGSLVRFLHHHFPSCRLDVIDCSQHIIDLAKGYFSLPVTPLISTHCDDGFDFLAARSGDAGYDLILVDAFDENGMAPSVYRPEFFSLCLNHLHPLGLLSANLWSGDKVRLEEVKHHLARRFRAVVELPVPNRGNVICLAGENPALRDPAYLDRRELTALSLRYGINFNHIVKIWCRHNLGFRQRIARLFS